MKHLKRVATFVLASLALTAGGTMALLACSSDSSVTTGDGGPTPNPPPNPVTPPPVVPPPPTDGGKDVVVVEAGTLEDFIAQNNQATCTRYKECCTAGADAAAFDTAKCLSDFAKAGWDQSLHDITKPGIADGGKVVFDPTAASDCLTAVRNMTCTNTPAAEFKNAWVKCYAAVHGTLGTGSPCTSAAECSTTGYCSFEAGTCQPLQATNSLCSRQEDPRSAECSYRASGDGQCIDDGTGTGTTKCINGFPNGTKDCFFDWECQSGACNNVDDSGINFQCDTKVDFLFGICDTYAK
jgi:hypothetical protein